LSQHPILNRQALSLRPDPARVIVRPFKPATEPRDLNPTDKTRANHIVDRVLTLDDETAASQLVDVLENFQGRHRNLLRAFEARAEEMESALADAFGGAKLETLPPDHPLYTAGGGAADEITYRNFAIRNGVGRTTAPRLQGITINGRLAVIYSREDLSVGMVGQAVDGIVGYSPATATALITRIINYINNPTPTTKKS